ncbi:uncharacterized protein LACBIDRAFT_306340 [Laccaria bicolor S238N-H82]|uniref:Predicted protein n=1 Tax=Laccaria bicolor (strain S238N-H82 / ATCC MYA-4686) TaxID=486041 RepID=B0DN59_LACBS|nr:uncharacterized protein LACBIDRAFT_306340 [Laccaria bicolor S238N-H82]EDR04088.1 predicted protein [Laccaria bicolor S238N-H82]|eukprot:XP_001885343.1 predicted protein [Laccaria bicolor S238N-H82]
MAQKRLPLYSEINSLSPIDQLPAEIKTEIFYNALGSLVNTEWRGIYSEWEGMYPFFLGKICRSWRDFVWSTPILWSTLHLCLSEDRYEAQIDLLHDWLSRISNHPISFCLDYEELPDDWDFHSPTEVLTTLASISSQWKDIELLLPDIKACFDAISTTGKPLPLLTTATIRFHPTSFNPELQLNLSMTPQLTVLHLSNPYLSKVLVPWHQLREFLAEGCTVDEIRIFFHNAPQIIHCTFKEINSVIMDHSLNLDLFHPVVLEHLECLKLWFSFLDESANWILGPAKLPSLREVSLHGPFASSAAILLRIMQAFCSSQLLENFALSYEVPSEIILIQVLELVPSITALRLRLTKHAGNFFLSEALFQRLYCPHNILLPNLQNFSYHGPISLTEHMDLFRDVLVYRFRQCTSPPKEVGSEQKTVSQIQSVTVDTSSQLVISPDIQEELDGLRRDGLDLSVTSHFVESRNFHEL